jgi:hypothetical protein
LIVGLDVGIPNGKNINNGIPMPRPTINSKLSTTKKI